jgi:hypothetical protein
VSPGQAGPETGQASDSRERLAKALLGAAWVLLAGAALLTLPHLAPWAAGVVRRYPEAALTAGALLCMITARRLRAGVSARKGQ